MDEMLIEVPVRVTNGWGRRVRERLGHLPLTVTGSIQGGCVKQHVLRECGEGGVLCRIEGRTYTYDPTREWKITEKGRTPGSLSTLCAVLRTEPQHPDE